MIRRDARRIVRPVRPCIEKLEDRCVPAAVDYFSQDGLLSIRGDRTNNVVQVETIGLNEIQVKADRAAIQTFHDVKKVVIQTGDGNDKITVKLNAAAAVDMFQIDGGNGADIIAILPAVEMPTDPMPGDLVPAVRINAGAGNDVVNVQTNELIGLLNVNLGIGDDHLEVEAAVDYFRATENMAGWDRTQIQIQGGAGNDDVKLNFANVQGTLAVNLGAGDDHLELEALVDYFRPTEGTVGWDRQILGGTGNDDVMLKFKNIQGALDVNLGVGDDHLELEALVDYFQPTEGTAGWDRTQIHGGAGNDDVTLNFTNVQGTLAVNLGAGDDHLELEALVDYFRPTEGTAGWDRQILGGAGNDDMTLNFKNVQGALDVNLGAGNDRLALDTDNPAPAPTAIPIDQMPTDQPPADPTSAAVIAIINVNAGGGDDKVDLQLGQGAAAVNLNLGAGNDVLRLQVGDPMVVDRTALDLAIAAGAGDDMIGLQLFKLPDLTSIALGAGNDMLRIYERIAGDSSTDQMPAEFRVVGGPGNDVANLDLATLPDTLDINLSPGVDKILRKAGGTR